MQIAEEHSAKVEELRLYLEGQACELSVATAWDFDRRAAKFRFDDAHGSVRHLLYISDLMLSDNSVAGIIQALEQNQWKASLERLGNQPAVLATHGVKRVHP
jgi:hypothetical protein